MTDRTLQTIETIMVVDDDQDVLELMRASLEGEGYVVLAAHNGAEALEVAARHGMPIQVMVTDVRMPQMGGAQLIEIVRRWHPALRCLIVSGYADFSDSLQAFEGTPTAFLAKPFAPDELTGAVRDLIDRPVLSTASRRGERLWQR